MVIYLSSLFLGALCVVQDPPSPVRIVGVEKPAEVILEAGGLLPRGQELFVCTRRGEIWKIGGAYGDSPTFTLFAEGLSEPLGLHETEDPRAFFVAQRGELSRVWDMDGDGRMDRLETVASGWPLSGNYHEYCFGPARAADGSLWLTLNKPFGDEPFGRADWRGFAIRVLADGRFEPVCAGLRSPAGVASAPWGEVFYSDNQGEWCPTSKFSLLEVGAFYGHPHGTESCEKPESKVAPLGKIESGATEEEFARRHPTYRLPAVWIPYDRLGRSPSGFVWDAEGNFGPYRGSVFMGDQYSCEVMRLTLEKVDGRWQGACYPFVKGLASGITRVAWGTDGSLWCGLTDRGWTATGTARDGIQRLVWDGPAVFDLLEVRAVQNGFALHFTEAVDPESLTTSALEVSRWQYHHHSNYGCREMDGTELAVTSLRVGASPTEVIAEIDGLRATWVHRLKLSGIRGAKAGAAPWHDEAFYTLNALASPR